MPDFSAISAAIAARYAAGQVTPPAGMGNIRMATADLPNGLTVLPAVLVYPDEGSFTHFPGKRDSGHDFAVRFYYTVAKDRARETNATSKWLGVLVDQLRLASQLGGTVTSAQVTSWRVGLLQYLGGDVMYAGIELTVRVVVNEAWAAVA